MAEMELRRRKREKWSRANQTYNHWLKNTSSNYNWDYPHLQEIDKFLQLYDNGEPLYLIILMPPQHGKSTFVTVNYPAYILDKYRDRRIMVVGHSTRFVNDNFAMPTKRILTEKDILKTSRSDLLTTSEGGFIKYFSFEAGVTGTPTDLIIIDDPYRNYEQAYSQVQRDKVWNEYKWGIVSRLRDSDNSKVSQILIMTPWHYDDIAHRLMAQKDKDGNPRWKILKLPALAKENDPLEREEGEPLCPELQSKESLQQKRKDDPSVFNALYQLSPEVDGGNIFKRTDWKRYTSLPIDIDYRLQSVDGAWTKEEQNDYCVCTTWDVKGNDTYLVDMWRDRVEYYDFKQQLISLGEYHKPNYILIENKASGIAAIQELKKDTRLPVQEVDPQGKKEVRARASSVMVRNGKVHVPENAPWLMDFLDEMSAFPKSKHDDIVDTVSMALNYITYNSGDPISII